MVRALWKRYVGFMTPLAATEEYCFTLFITPALRQSHKAQATRLLDRMLRFETREVEFWTRTLEHVMPHGVGKPPIPGERTLAFRRAWSQMLRPIQIFSVPQLCLPV